MTGVARITDMSTGHGCFPPQTTSSGSNNVAVDGLGVHRRTDSWPVHCCITCHPSTTVGSSSTVFINGLGAARIQDFINCGESIMTGSSTVFIGN